MFENMQNNDINIYVCHVLTTNSNRVAWVAVREQPSHSRRNHCQTLLLAFPYPVKDTRLAREVLEGGIYKCCLQSSGLSTVELHSWREMIMNTPPF